MTAVRSLHSETACNVHLQISRGESIGAKSCRAEDTTCLAWLAGYFCGCWKCSLARARLVPDFGPGNGKCQILVSK